MKIVIVIPTYNEAENVRRLVPMLEEEFKKAPHHEFHMLFVDGNSPDNTGGVVKEISQTYPNVHLLLEQKKAGLGAAYIYGFNYAMKEMNADVIIEMDADLQHDPKDVTRLTAEIDNGYDHVIGSRYTKGGSIPKEWSLLRKFYSVGGNLFAKVVLLMFDVNDFSSGFRATKVKGFMDKLDFDQVQSKGFAYKYDTLVQMRKLGARFKEVPIAFGTRERGSSKMEKGNPIDSFKVVVSIRLRESQNFFKFVVVGFAGLFTDLGIFNLNIFLGLKPQYASAVSGLVAMTVTYLLNNFWSFKERRITSFSQNVKSVIVYFVSSYIPIVFRSWLIGWAVAAFGHTTLVANGAFMIGVIIGLIWNFTVYSRIIWRKK